MKFICIATQKVNLWVGQKIKFSFCPMKTKNIGVTEFKIILSCLRFKQCVLTITDAWGEWGLCQSVRWWSGRRSRTGQEKEASQWTTEMKATQPHIRIVFKSHNCNSYLLNFHTLGSTLSWFQIEFILVENLSSQILKQKFNCLLLSAVKHLHN